MNYFYPTSLLFYLYRLKKKSNEQTDTKNYGELTACSIKFHLFVWMLCFSLLQSKLRLSEGVTGPFNDLRHLVE